MRRRAGAWLAVALLASTNATAASLAEAGLRHSDVALMPEGEPASIEVLQPLHPGVVAWGVDAVDTLDRPAVLKSRMDAYRTLGVSLLACNVWMLTATPRVLHDDPRYQDAVCRDIAGEPIVPRWLDAEYEGVKSYWGCTNHPLFREQLIARVRAGIAAGANLLHLDDHLGTLAAVEHSGGCFCEYCMRDFRIWLREHLTPERFQALGDMNSKPFDYRAYLRERGVTSRARYDATVQVLKLPLRESFLAFQREAATDFVRELGRVAAETAGHPVPVGVNAWNLAPTQLATAQVADYFANEVSHFDVEDLTPPRAYLLANALGKPVFSTGTGEDWIEVMQHGDVARVQRWIAEAQAFGHHFMYAYNKWAFSKATGTKWYQTPIDTYAPVVDFIHANPELFNGFEAACQVGVLYSNAAARRNDVDVEPIIRALHDAHYSVGLVVAGDDWLQHQLDEKELGRFEIVVVPDGVVLDSAQAAVLDRLREKRRVIPWRGVDELRSWTKPWITLEGPGRVWTLPRGSHWGGSPRMAVHLLNMEPVVAGTIAPVSGPLRVSILLRPQNQGGYSCATWHVPGRKAVELPLVDDGDYRWVEIPGVDLWGVLLLE